MVRLTLATLSVLILGVLAILWIARGERAEPRDLVLVDDQAQVEALLRAREGTRSNVTGRGAFHLEPITEEIARELFVVHLGSLVFNPWCYYRYAPGLDQTVAWPEHPDGEWKRVTNAKGLRADDERDFSAADVRILVAGDSHVDGVCNNSESLAQQLRELVAAREPGREVVALNTGVSGYSFYNYLGVLEEALAGEHGALPDVFVVGVYGGNDFVGVLRPHHYFRGTRIPPRRPHYWARIQAATRISTAALGQGLNQTAYFLENPEQIEVALEATRVLLSQMHRRCVENGVRMIVVHIPAAFDRPWPGLELLLERALESLELERSDLELALELRDAMAEHLAELGVEYIDMTEPFAASDELCYWTRDLHISVVGQRVIAEAVDEILSREASALEAPDADPLADGPFERRDPDGTLRAEGAHAGGLRSGLWTSYHSDGSLRMRGSYVEGERSGPWQWWYPGGQLQKQGTFVKDLAVGLWSDWYRDGQVRRKGEWRAGIAHGLWQEWHPNGNPASEGVLMEGRHEGLWRTWYPSGQLEVASTLERDQLHGPTESWHEDGTPRWRGEHREGVRHGHWTFWWPNGALRSEGLWVDGERHGEQRFYDEAGRLDPQTSGTYAAGERIAPLD